jgi:Protein of unknown function (DUF1553)/Protein of unknown function (DUF1549)/Bacterial Ig-like domain (group 2)
MLVIRALLTIVALLGTASAVRADSVPSFVNDIVPILTRYGCSQGSCHGKGVGQNGFRLSLRGYAPEQDHEWLTREFFGRRVNLADPESSPLLRKTSGEAAHVGGKLFGKDSKAYSLLLAWVRAGAPGPGKKDATLEGIRVLPERLALAPGASAHLKVEATFSDGTRRDVTWLCRFESNDPGQVEVDLAGKVRVRRHGETAVRASFQTGVAVAVITAARPTAIDPKHFAVKNNVVDEHVFAKLSALRIEPSGLCSDAEFMRRAHLDTIGVLPTPAEVRTFLANTAADKRKKLVDALLERPEFNDYWALFLSDLLQNRRERDHDVRGVKGVRDFHAWIRKQVADKRGWDQITRDVLLSSGKSSENAAVGYYVVTVGEHGDPTKSEVVDSVAQAFLGTRIGCARCHNHPLERYTQDDFYHFAGFFSRVKLDRQEAKKGPTTLRIAGTGGKEPHLAKEKVGVQQPRTNVFLAPRPLDRSVVAPFKPGDDPRVPLVNWIVDPKNETFSGSMVNRVWKHYLGVGLVEPVDDLRASNPPSNPELWKALNREFVAGKFDMRSLMRLILNSRTYQLNSATTAGNAADTQFYSHYIVRRLPAEVLLDAVSGATGEPEKFPGYPVGLRAVQLPDPGLGSYFLKLFGRSDRVTACACERSGEVTLPQLLHVQNSESFVAKVRADKGRLSKLIRDKKDDDAIIEELFLATLSRLPTAANLAAVRESVKDATSRDEAFQDLFWALMNTKEFSFNH